MFYGRERELEMLRRRYDSGVFEFIPVYGRRRVGKTTLIQKFVEGKEAVFFTATGNSLEHNLRRLASLVYGGDVTASLDSILSEVDRRSRERRFILVIDEYPRLLRDRDGVSDQLQEFIDRVKDGSKLFLILCGSSMNMMEHEVLGYRSPLYGRRTGSLKLEPFTYFEARAFLEGFSEEDKVRIYGMVGGAPMYLERFDPSRTLRENVVANFLDVGSIFRDEAVMTMMEEFHTPMRHIDVVGAVAEGCSKNAEVANATGMQAPNSLRLLRELCAPGIVEKRVPADDPNGKRVLYTVGDAFMAFHYREIHGRYESVPDGLKDEAAEEILASHENTLGFVFERICAQFVAGRGSVGTWWGTDPGTRTREEIDIVVTRRREGVTRRTFCECKYTGREVGPDVLEKLKRRSLLVKGTDESRFILFSRTGFSEALEDTDAELYTLEDMIRLGGEIPPEKRSPPSRVQVIPSRF